jgi:hypothetical protein
MRPRQWVSGALLNGFQLRPEAVALCFPLPLMHFDAALTVAAGKMRFDAIAIFYKVTWPTPLNLSFSA